MSEENLMEFDFDRLAVLSDEGKLCTVKCDDGAVVLCEIWRFPERRETDPDNEIEIYPFAKLLTQTDKDQLKINGEIPT